MADAPAPTPAPSWWFRSVADDEIRGPYAPEALLDFARRARTGFGETVFGPGKTPEQMVGIFRAFRENFKQATQLWLILLGAGLFLSADGYILYHLRKSSTGVMAVIWTLILALVIAASVLYVIELLYVFPLLASVHNTNAAMLKNAFLIGTHYLFATILVFAVHFAMFFAVVAIFTPLIIFGEGLCAMVSSWILNSLLISVSGTPEDYMEDSPEELPENTSDSIMKNYSEENT